MSTQNNRESLTEKIAELFEQYKDELTSSKPIFFAKIFNPMGSGVWYPMTYDEESNICYGMVLGIGYLKFESFSIEKLEQLKLPYDLQIEINEFFDIRTLESMLEYQKDLFNLARSEMVVGKQLKEITRARLEELEKNDSDKEIIKEL